MSWPLRLLLLPVMLLMHTVLVVVFACGCAVAVWQWLRGKLEARP